MLVEKELQEFLRTCEPWRVVIFSAGCAERMFQIFTGLQGSTAGRYSDVEFGISLLASLWDVEFNDAVLAAGALHRLEGFPEFQPRESPLLDPAAIYNFYAALTLRYAAASRLGNGVDAAISCGHAVLTSVGQLDRNPPDGSSLYIQEGELQNSIVNLTYESEVIGSFRARCQQLGRERFELVRARR